MKKTPLYDLHQQAGAKFVAFAGYDMPVEYTKLRDEHQRVREKVGLFDVSHMGEIFFRGSKSLESLQWMTTNDVSKLEKHQAQYSLIPNPQGGVVDDIIVYCLEPGEEYLVCVNASNIEKAFAFFQSHNKGADISNESENWAQIAIQGPKAMDLMKAVYSKEVEAIGRFYFSPISYADANTLVARTGYTGEDGFEVFVPNEQAAKLWQDLMEQGSDLGVGPIGLGARDTLRTEMKYSLYGHEIDDTTNPYAAGLGWVVKPKKGDFIGKDSILSAKEEGLVHKLVGFKLVDRGIPRAEYQAFSFDNTPIGRVTSGTHSPSLNEAIGIAYLLKDYGAEGSEFFVEIRGRKAKAIVVKTPFVDLKGA